MTTLAVVITANHFWLDGIVAGAILAIVLAVQVLVRRLLATRASQRSQDQPKEAEPAALTLSD
jgi:hypothetical protein